MNCNISQKTSQRVKNNSHLTRLRLVSYFLFFTHCDVICDLLQCTHTEKYHLILSQFVNYTITWLLHVSIFISCWLWSIKGHTRRWRQIHVRSRQQTCFSSFIPTKFFFIVSNSKERQSRDSLYCVGERRLWRRDWLCKAFSHSLSLSLWILYLIPVSSFEY